MKLKPYIFLFIILSLVMPLVISAPLFITSGEFSSGFVLEINHNEVLQAGQSLTLGVHIFNSTDGMSIIEGVGCYLHLYNISGSHILEMYENTPTHTFDYEFFIDGGNITTTTNNLIVQCNSSIAGGLIEENVIVTKTGKLETDGTSVFYFGFIFLLMSLISLSIYAWATSMKIQYKFLFFCLFWLLFIALNYSAWIGATNYMGDLTFLAIFFKWIFYISVLLLFPIILGSLVYIIYMAITIPEMKNMLKHGVPEGRAEGRFNRLNRKGRY